MKVRRTKTLTVKVPASTFKKGRNYGGGITLTRARNEWIKGFLQGAKKRKGTLYKDVKAFRFRFYK